MYMFYFVPQIRNYIFILYIEYRWCSICNKGIKRSCACNEYALLQPYNPNNY